jgi:sulfur-oxidizing protein SoxY
MSSDRSISRRQMLGALGTLAAAGATGALAIAPPAAASTEQIGVQESVQDALKRVFANRPMKDGAAIVKLDVPLIAENGAVVPVAVDVTSPMTANNYVRYVYIVADKNRIPLVARAMFTPEAGQAAMAVAVRLGESGDVRAIVEQSDGTLLQVKREVKVTVGGCGG